MACVGARVHWRSDLRVDTVNTRPLEPETQAWVLTLYRRRWSILKIANALGTAWKTVRNCLEAWGLRAVKRGRRVRG